MDRVAIFADVQNLYYTTRQAFGRNFDYNAFWKVATEGREVVKANSPNTPLYPIVGYSQLHSVRFR